MKTLAKWSKQNWLVWVVAVAYLVMAVTRPAEAARAASLSVQTAVDLIATLLTVFVFVGLFQVWINDEFIMKHLGEQSGVKGLALGAGLGTVLHRTAHRGVPALAGPACEGREARSGGRDRVDMGDQAAHDPSRDQAVRLEVRASAQCAAVPHPRSLWRPSWSGRWEKAGLTASAERPERSRHGPNDTACPPMGRRRRGRPDGLPQILRRVKAIRFSC